MESKFSKRFKEKKKKRSEVEVKTFGKAKKR